MRGRMAGVLEGGRRTRDEAQHEQWKQDHQRHVERIGGLARDPLGPGARRLQRRDRCAPRPDVKDGPKLRVGRAHEAAGCRPGGGDYQGARSGTRSLITLTATPLSQTFAERRKCRWRPRQPYPTPSHTSIKPTIFPRHGRSERFGRENQRRRVALRTIARNHSWCPGGSCAGELFDGWPLSEYIVNRQRWVSARRKSR